MQKLQLQRNSILQQATSRLKINLKDYMLLDSGVFKKIKKNNKKADGKKN